MKTIFHIILFFLLGAVLLPSCTKLSDPYYTVKSIYVDTTKRSVLLEDYTGHMCPNCPPAGKMANSLQELYPGQVFVMAVHAGDFARPDDDPDYYPYLLNDFTTAAGNVWNTYSGFHIEEWGYPRGMINRRTYSSKGGISVGPADWSQAIQTAIELPKVAVMTVRNTFNSQSKNLSTTVDIKFILSYTGKVNLNVCLLEDSIYSGQLNSVKPDSMPIIKHFRFMHMLRDTKGGNFGDEIAVNPAASGNVITKSYSFDFNGKPWVANHCNVVAFISDGDTKEILHVSKSTFIKP
jgi:hypothetical protein